MFGATSDVWPQRCQKDHFHRSIVRTPTVRREAKGSEQKTDKILLRKNYFPIYSAERFWLLVEKKLKEDKQKQPVRVLLW